MNKFQYTIKIEEMQRLTTKVLKAKFVKDNLISRYKTDNIDYYSILLLIDMYKAFKDDEIPNIIGIQNLISVLIGNVINSYIRSNKQFDERLLELQLLLNSIDEHKLIPYNAFGKFTNSAGIPAYLKLAVLKAYKDNESVH